MSAETLTAILDALDSAPGAAGPGRGEQSGGQAGLARPRIPDRRSWGFTVQLYSVRSRGSWGHGDLRDLADLAAWSARELGAGFVLINPLHAAEPLPPVSNSPYLPMTRRYVSPLYLRIEDIAEYRAARRRAAGADRRRSPRRCGPASTTPALIDRDAVWAAKRRALEMIYRVPLATPGASEYCSGSASARAASSTHWARLVRARRAARTRLARLAGPSRRSAPPRPRPRQRRRQAEFHAWLQWLADEQLAAAQRAALAAGMAIGIISDLAVGAHPGGADAWAHQDLLVRGMSVGAPPDEFNQRGQDWSQPPWHPRRLAAAGYRPLNELFGAGAPARRRAAGRSRDGPDAAVVDARGQAARPRRVRPLRPPLHGGRAGRAGGPGRGAGDRRGPRHRRPVDPRVPDRPAGILGTEMLWFAREPDGTPLRPRALAARAAWRRWAPTTCRRSPRSCTGDQVTVRARLGLLTEPDEAERESARQLLSQWRKALVGRGADPGRARCPARTSSPWRCTGTWPARAARLIGVSLADAVGDRRTQNIPGTSDEYPNWRIPLCDGGRPARSCSRTCPACRLVRAGRRAPPASGLRQPAWASRSRQRSARATSSRPSVSSRRSAAGGSVRSMYSSVDAIVSGRDPSRRVGELGEVLRHVRAPVLPDVRHHVEVAAARTARAAPRGRGR